LKWWKNFENFAKMADPIVLDASVAAKWFLKDEQESYIEQADELLIRLLADDIELYAPRVIHFEVCHLLNKATRQPDPKNGTFRLSKEKAIQSAREFLALPLYILDATEQEYVWALEMAIDYHRGHADMMYMALAERLDCQWCTADDNVLEGVQATFPSTQVMLLSAL
jgi:predicted nucleic acid-binding protein